MGEFNISEPTSHCKNRQASVNSHVVELVVFSTESSTTIFNPKCPKIRLSSFCMCGAVGFLTQSLDQWIRPPPETHDLICFWEPIISVINDKTMRNFTYGSYLRRIGISGTNNIGNLITKVADYLVVIGALKINVISFIRDDAIRS